MNMNNSPLQIRNAKTSELDRVGELMVEVYSALEGFPKPADQPAYYQLLRNVGQLVQKPGVEILVAVDSGERVLGAVVYFNDIQYYGSGGTATQEKNAAGFRLLAVDPVARGRGIGRLLTEACISKARHQNLSQLIIHSTRAMQIAWKMYESIGFQRSSDLDFKQQSLEVFGFRLKLREPA